MRGSPFLSSSYSPGSFYFARGLWGLSTAIVTAILVFFTIHLHADGFKLPYAFVLLFLTCFLTLLSLILTGILYCSNRLGPVLSMILNIILLLLWMVSLGILGYSMKGTITTSCDTKDWGTSTGVMVCRLYKTLFSFVVVSLVMAFFHICLDIIARRDRYNLSAVGSIRYRDDDIKLHDRTESSVPALSAGGGGLATTEGLDAGHRADAYNAFGTVRPEEPQYTHRHRVPEDDFQQTATFESTNMATNPYHDGFDNEPLPVAAHHHAVGGYGYGGNNVNRNHNDYYDGVPDIPAPGPRWAPTSTPYSPLQSRFDEPTGYDSYRPAPTHQHTSYDRYDFAR